MKTHKILIHTFVIIALLCTGKWVFAAQQPLNAIPKSTATNAVTVIREGVNTELAKQQSMNTELYAADILKANASCFADSAAFDACFALDWPTGFDVTANYTVTGSWDFTGATVTGISGGSMVYPGAGITVSTGSAWGTSITPGTGVATALGFAPNTAGGFLLYSTYAADPLIEWGTGLTETVDSPTPGTNTISVTPNTYLPYDADWLGITANGAALVSAANYVAMRALLDLEVGTDFNAYDADLTTWAGITPGVGVDTALSQNVGAVGGLPKIIASGTYTVDTASISANTCASAVAVTATGVATTDTIITTPNAILSSVAGFGVTTAGAVRVDVYPTSGNVNFQFCNPTGTAIDPGSVTFNWKVLR